MCRLFAVCSQTPVPVRRAFSALRSQSHEHRDGWGVVHFNTGAAFLETHVDPAHASDRFHELGRTLVSKTLVAHIRLASVGSVKPLNSHPFVAGGLCFSHNGTLRHFAARQQYFNELIDPGELALVRGETDSERCFALLRTRLGTDRSLEGVARGIVSVIQTASELFDRDLSPDEKRSSMNFVVTDGVRLWASRRGRTLFSMGSHGMQMVASEQLWHDDDWVPLEEDSLLAIDENQRARRYRFDELR